MNILALMGSPRKKDTYGICREIEQLAQACEPSVVTYRFIGEADLSYCRGCLLCFHKGEEHCPINDGIKNIWEEMQQADAVIFSSPVYAHHVTALMKNFIDRSSYFYHRPVFFDKAAIVVATTNTTGLDDTIEYLTGTAKGWGFRFAGSLGVKMVDYRHDEAYRTRMQADMRRLVGNLLDAVQQPLRPPPSLGDLIYFEMMKKKATHLEADELFWKEREWYERSYYLDVPIPRWKSFLARQIARHL